MEIEYRKKFLKELSKINKGERLRVESFVFEKHPKANSIFELGKYRAYERLPLALQGSLWSI